MKSFAATAESWVQANAASPSPVAPVPRPKLALSPPTPGRSDLGAEESARFLQFVGSCAHIASHYELFLLVQGQLQYFLPQDILIAAYGQFGSEDPQVDVISDIAGVRTERLCRIVVPLAKRMHKRWVDGGLEAITLNESVADLQSCDIAHQCAESCTYPDMRLTLVHGTRNKRDGYDSLYIALRQPPFALDATQTRMRHLTDSVINQLDIAFRKVAALDALDERTGESAPALLSVREEEIAYWVCQGKTNLQIAQILDISVNTVKNHVARIFEKLGANNRTQVVAKCKNPAAGALEL